VLVLCTELRCSPAQMLAPGCSIEGMTTLGCGSTGVVTWTCTWLQRIWTDCCGVLLLLLLLLLPLLLLLRMCCLWRLLLPARATGSSCKYTAPPWQQPETVLPATAHINPVAALLNCLASSNSAGAGTLSCAGCICCPQAAAVRTGQQSKQA
jgi:hypothetical protein